MSGILRYAPRHFLDLLVTRGAGIITIGFLFVFPVYLGGDIGPLEKELERQQLVRVFGEMLVPLGVFFTLLACYGIAGADRREGFYRFMFARRISPVRYYALSYLLATLVYVIGLLATLAIWAALVQPIWPRAYLGEILADYFLLSALIMLLSPLTRGDWLVALMALGLSQGLRSTYPSEGSVVGRVLDAILPPTSTGSMFPLDGGVHWKPLLVQLSYAAALFLLALVIVRKRPLGTTG